MNWNVSLPLSVGILSKEFHVYAYQVFDNRAIGLCTVRRGPHVRGEREWVDRSEHFRIL